MTAEHELLKTILINTLHIIQAIDKLVALLNGDLPSGQNLFGPKEYVEIYT